MGDGPAPPDPEPRSLRFCWTSDKSAAKTNEEAVLDQISRHVLRYHTWIWRFTTCLHDRWDRDFWQVLGVAVVFKLGHYSLECLICWHHIGPLDLGIDDGSCHRGWLVRRDFWNNFLISFFVKIFSENSRPRQVEQPCPEWAENLAIEASFQTWFLDVSCWCAWVRSQLLVVFSQRHSIIDITNIEE